MHTSVILDTWLCCMYLWCGWNFVTNGRTDERTDEQGDSRSRMTQKDNLLSAQWISNWYLTFAMNCSWQLAGITNCSSAIQCSHFSDDYCQIIVQLLMTVKWLTDWLMAAKFWRFVHWLIAANWLIDDTKPMLRLCWRLLSNLRSMIDKAGARPGWIGPTKSQLSKKKPNLIIFQRNWT